MLHKIPGVNHQSLFSISTHFHEKEPANYDDKKKYDSVCRIKPACARLECFNSIQKCLQNVHRNKDYLVFVSYTIHKIFNLTKSITNSKVCPDTSIVKRIKDGQFCPKNLGNHCGNCDRGNPHFALFWCARTSLSRRIFPRIFCSWYWNLDFWRNANCFLFYLAFCDV